MKTPLPSKLVIVQFVRTVEILRYTSDYALSCFKLKIKIVVCCHISENNNNMEKKLIFASAFQSLVRQ